jgi:DNA-3-methyladenine glycosylase I
MNQLNQVNQTIENPNVRCAWCGNEEPYLSYHDREWGVPLHDDQKLFELLILEGAQAGLSWLTVLKKRDNYRAAYMQFEIAEVAEFDHEKIESLLANPGIIRVRVSITNAKVALLLQREYGSLDAYFWSYVSHTPLQPRYTSDTKLPPTTDTASRISKDLKKRGMNFVGPTIIYAFMQASGMTNDHIISCFRYHELI